jgi:hypothetical protein
MKSHSRRPRRDFSCPPDRTPRPRRAFPAMPQPRQAGRLFFSPHASPPRPSPHAPHPAVAARHTAPTAPDRLFFIASPYHHPHQANLLTPAQPQTPYCAPRPHTTPGFSPAPGGIFPAFPTAHPTPRRAFPATPAPAHHDRLFPPPPQTAGIFSCRPRLQRGVPPHPHTAPTAPDRLFFIATPAHPPLAGHFPSRPNPVKPADFSSSPARTPRPRRDFSCPPDRTPTPRRTVHPAILRLHTHPTNPEAHHLPLTRRSLPLPQQFFSYGDCFGCAEQV